MHPSKDEEPADYSAKGASPGANDQRLREFADSAPAMLWVTEPDGSCSFLSRGWYEFTGQAEAEALGFGWLDAVHPEDRERAGRDFRESNARQVQFHCEYRFRRADGVYRWGIDIGRPRLSPAGDYLGYVGSVIDIDDRKRAEELTKRLDERRRLALDAAGLGSWNIDPDAKLLEGDERFHAITSGETKPLTYEEAFGFIHDEDQDRVRAAVEASMQPDNPDPYAEEYRVVHRDGSVRWVVGKGRAKFTGEGEGRRLTSFDGTVADITDRKRADQELRESEQRFRALVNATSDVVYRLSPDWSEMRPLDGRGLLPSTDAPLRDWAWLHRNLPAFEHDRVKDVIRGAIAGKRIFELEHRVNRPDGSLGWTFSRAVPIFDAVGDIVEWFGTASDVTRRKEAEEAREHRARQLKRLADISARLNAAHDVQSVVRVVTEEARQLIGTKQAATSIAVSPHQPEPLSVVSTSEEPLHESAEVSIRASELREAVDAENRPVRLAQSELEHDPRWKTLQKVALVKPVANGWLAAPLIARGGEALGLLQLADKAEGEFTEDDEAILVQLSRLASIAIENARLYEELRGNDQRKNEFLAMLAHELRNPLSAIGNAVTLTTRGGLQEHIEWSMDVITRQMKHLTRLIDDLLDVSRISRGKIELRRDVLDLTPILDSAVATARPLMEERKHTLDLGVDRGELWASVDPTRLEQVVVNLLNNAAKYSENGGHVRLSARKVGDEVVITVTDRGVGIPPEKLPQMFELFAQGDRSLARSEGGLGIGLTVVKKLAEMHGGSVAARSEGPGKGSEFKVRLPRAARPAAAASEREELPRGREPARILVVDDNVDTARGMARLMKLLGHEVAIAHSGPDGIEVARSHRPEFVLLDIGLPGMDGYEVAARLRREECCGDAVIIAISGYGQDEDRRRSKEAGFDHHLIKPLDHDALLYLLSTGANGRE